MKIEALQENVKEALNHLQRVIPSKPQLPILSSVLLQAKNGIISVSATDLYLGVTTQLAGVVKEEGVVAVPGKIFREAVNTLSPGKLVLELQQESLIISAERSTITLQCMPSEEFPDFPTLTEDKQAFSLQRLRDIDQLIGFSVSLDPTRPVLTAVLLSFDQGGVLAVGTDGFRLSTLRMKDMQDPEGQRLLVPARAIAEVSRLASQSDEQEVGFQVSQELKQCLFSVGQTQIFARLLDGDYPPFEKIIPSGYTQEVVMDGQELEQLLKQALVFAREASNIVRFSLDGTQMTIASLSPSSGKQEGTMVVERRAGEKSEIAFNIRYLLDFLSAVKPEQVLFAMNESLTPALFRPLGQEEYGYVVMPFRVAE